MKYKIGDRVYYMGKKYKITGIRRTIYGDLLAFHWSSNFIDSSRFKPIVRCGNEY